MTVLMDGIVFGESLRWHAGRVWLADWAMGQVLALDDEGRHEVITEVDSFPLCFDVMPDGRVLLVDSAQRRLLRREVDGSLAVHADLSDQSHHPWNEVVLDTDGAAYVNGIGYDFPEGRPGPGFVVLVTADGAVRRVADDLAFPNGMALVGRTLVVAESHASRLTAYTVEADGGLADRRVWADTPDYHPDGICVDVEGAVWFADVGTARCVRVREGGEVLQTVQLDRGAFSCALSSGEDPRLYVVGQQWGAEDGTPTGQVQVFPAPSPGLER